jgi:hypothetical protein
MASFNDFISALRGAPTTGAQLNKDEAKLLAERQRVANAPVHIDDVVAKAVNGTRKRAADAVAHLVRNHLNADSMAATHPDSIENDATVFDLLALSEGKAHPANAGTDIASIFPQAATPHSGMLAYLLMPQVEQATEALVREHLTDACKGGVRLADRRKRLADIDAKLAAIRAQRAELAAGLREAARHLSGTPDAVAKGPSDSDVAGEFAAYQREEAERVAREAAAANVGE